MFGNQISITSPLLVSVIGGENKLETDEKLYVTDLICEGPIEGLVDKNGNLLKYITDTDGSQVDNLILGKGVYCNEVPLIDSKLNKLNFVTNGFNITYGDEISEPRSEYPSTIFKYNQKLYLNEIDYTNTFAVNLNGVFGFQVYYGNQGKVYSPLTSDKGDAFAASLNARSLIELETILDKAKQSVQEFSHKIRNKYTDTLSIQVQIDQLFDTDKTGNVGGQTLFYAIEISEDNSSDRLFCIVAVNGVSKSNYTVDITIKDLDLDNQKQNAYYVKVYALSKKIMPTQTRIFKNFNLSSVIEKVKNRGNFSYPFSAIVKSAISSRHFNSDPARSFDLKLLKIKVPSNYDFEAHEYIGNWNGNFDAFLRWTDNPAWVFYDICTNTRYGVGSGKILEKDLNKWELYKIARYCDELVKTNQPLRYPPLGFWIDDQYPNCIMVEKGGYTLEQFKYMYPPVYGDTKYANQNGGFSNSIVYLYDLKDADKQDINKSLKKIIWSVEEMEAGFKVKLINDFGPRKAFERETTGRLLKDFAESNVLTYTYGTAAGNEPTTSATNISNRITNSSKNSEDGAKSFILDWYVKNINSAYVNLVLSEEVFVEDYLEATLNLGTCSPKVLNFREAVEPRFTCNILIDNETDCLKILNDISSIFRGITYYKNNLINSTIDVNKSVSYIFNNSNIKNGLFTYSTGSLEGNYTVAKIMYKDRFENFTEQVEIVEDTKMIKHYGVITKEILGFGITSKSQARRIGQWLLATNRFENQTVTFSTDIQGLLIKPGDVIQIQDQFKNDTALQGRVTGVDYTNKRITVDRKLNLNLTGGIIKFVYDSLQTTVNDLSAKQTVTTQDINSLDTQNVISLKIDRIENNTNTVYFDETYNFQDFYKILKTAPFIIEDPNVNNSENLYKIVTISEADNNEYSVFAIKHDPYKYEYLDKNKFEDTNSDPLNNTITFTNYDNLTEIDLGDLQYYSTEKYLVNDIQNLKIDYYFNEQRSSLVYSGSNDYVVLSLYFTNIFNYINSQASTSSYYSNITDVFTRGGGIVCKLTLKNQTIKFLVPYASYSDKKVFLGKYNEKTSLSSTSLQPAAISASSGIRLYVYNKDCQIIEV